ncbi:TPA: hypothetical protein KOR49_002419 [Clostridioides difficile]|uniref:Uncharacterized protein n=1 Tax=Clostridioides difficile TaxID=1496 RepID=A0AAN5VLG5_CLODI|nr:hypothetical protein [Clostridioides difficile]EGT3944007.1 hypothetical protein [Clostridioides difficile]MBG0197955.1 hypothetical protein [Clostridioides difficile]MCA0574611.1 hypothetical protein [Clostridioides difficile]MCM0739719.1 hypothetical protein [Clostridioides difficile]MDW0076917.1 hypothetical protein [Clostridioides difficile]
MKITNKTKKEINCGNYYNTKEALELLEIGYNSFNKLMEENLVDVYAITLNNKDRYAYYFHEEDLYTVKFMLIMNGFYKKSRLRKVI